VLDPLPVEIINHPGPTLRIEVPNGPSKLAMGTRLLELGKIVYIERRDFRKNDEDGFYGLALGKTVNLLFAGDITCVGFDLASDGEVSFLRCTLDLAHGSETPVGKLHWVSDGARKAEVRLYSRMFNVEKPGGKGNKADDSDEETDDAVVNKDIDVAELNPESLTVCADALLEPSLATVSEMEGNVEFMRRGYFCFDKDSKPGAFVFNRTCF